ncbi:DUF554 domain-containing protein [Oribacterium sp. WCC10]|uniref:DUF554 domain-containing protein n=1 Tax=Oribacterium sp. WCC10 TaxID=1855343 RepID=UPI0008EA2760|nr:DUF554 domain-containing protein [Oribacterium sp. WCC10]SFG64202.1 hypothetical protein SAMN05216356_11668 [Oribacterium sp. WCC10]
MPIGVLVNAFSIFVGGLIGNVVGSKLSSKVIESMNTVFGACAMSMGISSIVLMSNLPAVMLSVIVGTAVGLAIHLGDKITAGGLCMEKGISKIFPGKKENEEEYKKQLVTAIVLFCASGTGIYGSIVSGMTGDHSILLAKSIMDIATALIFACSLGIVTSFIAIPQLIIFLLLFVFANIIYPFCSDSMINDFKACGGVLLIATGFRMIRVKDFPVADMIPAMVLAMPVSFLWTTYILPLVS